MVEFQFDGDAVAEALGYKPDANGELPMTDEERENAEAQLAAAATLATMGVPEERALMPFQPLDQRVSIGGAEWNGILGIGRSLVKSHLLPDAIKTPEQAAAIILVGRELGIPAMAAFRTIDVINGVPTIRPQLMLALIRRSGLLERFEVMDDGQGCTCVMTRKGEPLHLERFTMQDALGLGLTGKKNWKAQPETMRKWRAIGACARVVFPDIILGLYTTEELEADYTVSVEDGSTVSLAPTDGFAFEGQAPDGPNPFASDEGVVEGSFRESPAEPTTAFTFS